MILSSACRQWRADTHPTIWDEPWSSKLHHVLGHDPAQQVSLLLARGAPDIDMAVLAANSALQTTWRRFGPSDRERVLSRLADLVEKIAKPIVSVQLLR